MNETKKVPGTIGPLSAAEETTLDSNGVPVKIGRQYRRTQVKTEGYNADEHTVELTLTSEYPVERYFGSEVLSHKKGAIRTTRLKNGISLLFNHDYDQLLGRSVSYKTPDGGPLSLVYRFGPSALSLEKEAEVAAGILVDTSGGYQVYEWEITEDKNGVRTYLGVDWEPLEGSLVTVPADPNVGAGRGLATKYTLRKLGEDGEVVSSRKFAFDPESNSTRSLDSDEAPPVALPAIETGARAVDADEGAENNDPESEDDETGDKKPAAAARSAESSAPPSSTTTSDQRTAATMAETTNTPVADVVEPAVLEATRVAGLRKLHTDYPKEFNERSLQTAIALETELKAARNTVAELVISNSQRENVDTIGDEILGSMSERELREFSLRDAYAASYNARHKGTFTDKGATGFVLEIDKSMRTLAAERGIDNIGPGIVIPSASARSRRALQQRTIASGGNAGTATNFTIVEQDPIELLRAKVAVFALGATMLSGLKGKLQMPRQNAAASSNWLLEGNAATNSDLGLDDIVMQPNRLSMQNSYYRDFLAQSRLAIEGLLTEDRYAVLQRSLDTAAITGSGTAPVPMGLLNRTGLAAVLAGSTRNTSTGVVTAGAGGTPMTYVDYNNMEAAISTANGDIGTLRWLLTPKVRAGGRSTPKIPGLGSDVVFPDSAVAANGIQTGPLGYGALATSASYLTGFTANSISNLHAIILGVWNQLLVGDWGLSEVIVDDVTGAANAKVIITEHAFYDVNVRHIEAFCACTSALPQ